MTGQMEKWIFLTHSLMECGTAAGLGVGGSGGGRSYLWQLVCMVRVVGKVPAVFCLPVRATGGEGFPVESSLERATEY